MVHGTLRDSLFYLFSSHFLTSNVGSTLTLSLPGGVLMKRITVPGCER